MVRRVPPDDRQAWREALNTLRTHREELMQAIAEQAEQEERSDDDDAR